MGPAGPDRSPSPRRPHEDDARGHRLRSGALGQPVAAGRHLDRPGSAHQRFGRPDGQGWTAGGRRDRQDQVDAFEVRPQDRFAGEPQEGRRVGQDPGGHGLRGLGRRRRVVLDRRRHPGAPRAGAGRGGAEDAGRDLPPHGRQVRRDVPDLREPRDQHGLLLEQERGGAGGPQGPVPDHRQAAGVPQHLLLDRRPAGATEARGRAQRPQPQDR